MDWIREYALEIGIGATLVVLIVLLVIGEGSFQRANHQLAVECRANGVAPNVCSQDSAQRQFQKDLAQSAAFAAGAIAGSRR